MSTGLLVEPTGAPYESIATGPVGAKTAGNRKLSPRDQSLWAATARHNRRAQNREGIENQTTGRPRTARCLVLGSSDRSNFHSSSVKLVRYKIDFRIL
jgi:hypothetical protein